MNRDRMIQNLLNDREQLRRDLRELRSATPSRRWRRLVLQKENLLLIAESLLADVETENITVYPLGYDRGGLRLVCAKRKCCKGQLVTADDVESA